MPKPKKITKNRKSKYDVWKKEQWGGYSTTLTQLRKLGTANAIDRALSLLPTGEFYISGFGRMDEGQCWKVSKLVFVVLNTAAGGHYEDWFDRKGFAEALLKDDNSYMKNRYQSFEGEVDFDDVIDATIKNWKRKTRGFKTDSLLHTLRYDLDLRKTLSREYKADRMILILMQANWAVQNNIKDNASAIIAKEGLAWVKETPRD